MSLQEIILAALSLGFSVLGWFARELYSAVQSLRKDLSALEVRITRDYIPYDRLQDALKPIMDSLSEIKSTLAGKADK